MIGFLNNLYTFKITQNNQVDYKFKFKTCVYISIQQENRVVLSDVRTPEAFYRTKQMDGRTVPDITDGRYRTGVLFIGEYSLKIPQICTKYLKYTWIYSNIFSQRPFDLYWTSHKVYWTDGQSCIPIRLVDNLARKCKKHLIKSHESIKYNRGYD